MNDILNYIVSKFKCEIDAMNTVNYTTGYGTKKKILCLFLDDRRYNTKEYLC